MIRVFDKNGKKYDIDEKNFINSGGEGKVISIGGGRVAKLYFEASNAISDEKIRELSCLDGNYFIKPEIGVSGDLNGYIMPELDNSAYFPLYFLYSEKFCIKNSFPSDYKNEISKKMVSAVKDAHSHGIVIGDLNPFNIMVSNKLDVKFIDVDSYETKSCKHNDKLLEEIRDYKNGGKISMESDYFALAVCIFNLFTGIHPYKGIHNVYKDCLKDREINDLSLMNEAEFKNIKVPKFYKPISDKAISDEFRDIFQNNVRKLITFGKDYVDNMVFNSVISSADLLITSVMDGNIVDVQMSDYYMCVSTKDGNFVYETPSTGIYMNLFKTSGDVKIILTDKYVYGFKGGSLKRFDKAEKKFVEITSLYFSGIYIIKQYENILAVLTNDNKFYTIYLDETFANSVKYTVFDAFSKSFFKRNGLVQNLGERSAFLYNNGKCLSTVIFKRRIDDIEQKGNVGIVQYTENSKSVFDLFSIDKYGSVKLKRLQDKVVFTSNDKFIILYEDDKIRFIDKDSLTEVCSFAADGIDAYNILYGKCGIVAYNNSEVKLINTK